MDRVKTSIPNTEIQASKDLWLPAMVYRIIGDPVDDEGITRGLLAFTFSEEPPEHINKIVDAFIKVGIVADDGKNLTVLPYDEN